MSLKFQLGFMFSQKVFAHSYSFNNQAYSPRMVDAITLHPVTFPINISLGLIFKHSKNVYENTENQY